jgi:isopentenyl-diphosphate delta-isomerase
MVGGIEASRHINRNLALAAQDLGLAMGVGSQRCAIEDPVAVNTYHVRDVAPDILLFANLGAVQLNYGYGLDQCVRAVEMIDADGLVLHLNPLQEALQGGDTDFSGILDRIRDVCRGVGVPVVVKEVGYGISEKTARELLEAGVSGIDVAGAGGTAWSDMERHRAPSAREKRIASNFASWGIPTADSIQMVRRACPGHPLIASGGIRTGIDVAKCIALGADGAGLAMPLLHPADHSAEAVKDVLQPVIHELRLSMFCIGAGSLAALRDSPHLEKRC